MKGALDLNQFDLADSVLESILDNHNTARFVLDDPTVHRFHRMFWTKAAELAIKFLDSDNAIDVAQIAGPNLVMISCWCFTLN